MQPKDSSHLAALRFAVEYHLTGAEAQAREQARLICIDQTVEASDEVIPPGPIRDEIVGRVESFRRLDAGRYEAVISYAGELMGESGTQFLNVVFGICSLKPGIRVARLRLREALLAGWSGPRFGREGLRQLVGVPDRPLVCGVLKPLGFSPAQLAALAQQFALGGVDVIKEDQGLADHPFCSFTERVARCAEAIANANRETGRTCLYVPHVSGPWALLRERSLFAKRAGAGGVLVCPGLTGFDALRDLARDEAVALPILSHPALLGTFTAHEDSGIAPAVLYGQLPRLCGADATLYPIYGSEYAMSRADCAAIKEETGAPWGRLRPIFPTAAGRIGFDRIAELCAFYGRDVLFVLGSRIQQETDGVVRACQKFVEEVGRCLKL